MKINVKPINVEAVDIDIKRTDTLTDIKKKIYKALEFELDKKQTFNLIHKNEDLEDKSVLEELFQCFDDQKANHVENIQLITVSLRCGLTLKEWQDVAKLTAIFSPIIGGILACVGLSVAAGLVSMTPLALGFTVAAALIVLIAGIAGVAGVIAHQSKLVATATPKASFIAIAAAHFEQVSQRLSSRYTDRMLLSNNNQ